MGHNILVVEDQADVRRALVGSLTSSWIDCEVIGVENETRAKQLIEERLFAVIVADLDLSLALGDKEGGFAVLQAARKRDPHTQLIVVASHTTADQLRRIHDLSVLIYINRHEPESDKKTLDSVKQGLEAFKSLRGTDFAIAVRVPQGRSERLSFRVSTQRQTVASSQPPIEFDPALWKELSAALGALANSSPEPLSDILPQFIGGELWNRLFRDYVELRRALDRAHMSAGKHWEHVMLLFEGHREILDVPFELLHDGEEYLALRQPVVVVPQGGNGAGRPFRSFGQADPLRALLLAANTCTTDGLGPIDLVDEEIDRIASELDPDGSNCDIVRVHSWELSSKAIDRLKERWHIVHFAGHGTYQHARPDRSVLYYWENECDEFKWKEACAIGPGRMRALRGEPRTLSATQLRYSLSQAESKPWLVYLNCCHSARSASRNALYSCASLGLMDAAVQAGVPVVVGNRWPVRDDKATLNMIGYFYRQLRLDYRPEHALCRARMSAAHADGRDVVTWASPVMATSY
jgi:CheY-like chemotaxis protein